MRVLISAMLLLLGSIGPLAAQDYPSRPITIITGSPPGSSIDLTARYFGERMREKTGQPWLMVQKGGALGSVAAQAVAMAKPDGYTGYFCTSGALSSNQYLLKTLNYDPQKDFQLVARLFKIELALVVNSDKTPVKTLAELTAFLKAKSGKISYGYYAPSMKAIAAQYLQLEGITASPVGYQSPANMMSDFEAGEFDFAASSLDLKPSSKLRILAIASETRSPLFPDVPTQTEAGLANALPLTSWFGFCLPARTPDAVAKTLGPTMLEIARSDEFKTFLKPFAAVPYPGDTAEFVKTRDQSTKDWKVFVDLAKLAPE